MKKENSLLIVIVSLLIFGLVVIANSTIISSTTLYKDPYKFAILQLSWIVLGLMGFFFFRRLNYKKLAKFSYVLFVITVLMLGILAFVGILPCSTNLSFAPCVNGANRWLYLNPAPFPKIPFLGVLGFQPGELAKLALILYLSFQLGKNLKEKRHVFLVYLISSVVASGLILLQPNMSTAALVFLIGTIVYFASGASLKELFVIFPTLVVVGAGSILFSPYRRSRLLTLISGNSDSELGSGYHIKQILLALGSGGFWGVGFGQSKQKFSYLPEVASDSIFAIIGEEFGFIGTTIVVSTFGYLIYRGFSIAKNCQDLTGKLLATGIISWIGLQFFVNVAAMVKIIPLTGVPIPLISYGGSSMLFTLCALGILANIESQE